MITKHDLLDAISACQGARNPNARTIELLAALYTVRDHMAREETQSAQSESDYSFAPGPKQDIVRYIGQSAFARAIYGHPEQDAWRLMDDLMSSVKMQNPRLYDSIMRQL